MVNRGGLEPPTRCCIQKCYVVGSSSISLRHAAWFYTVFGTVLFLKLCPRLWVACWSAPHAEGMALPALPGPRQ